MKHLGKIIIGSLFLAMLGITTLLIIEYRFFHDQAQKMLELKEEYRTYTTAVKKILNEYNAMKEQAAEEEATASQIAENRDSFILVNREPAYLRKSTLNYARKQNLEFLLSQVDPNEWVDYSDQLKQKSNKSKAPAKKRTRRGKKSRGQAYPRFYSDTSVTAAKDINFVWPIKRSDFWLSSFFGPRRKPDRSWGFHYGIDMAACRGTPIIAAADGIVLEAFFHNGFGNTILIQHNNKYKTRYAHLDKMHVSVGQKVEQGQLIGKVGATGAVRKKKGRDASHLHFEVYSHGKQINPLAFFM